MNLAVMMAHEQSDAAAQGRAHRANTFSLHSAGFEPVTLHSPVSLSCPISCTHFAVRLGGLPLT